MFRWLCRQFLGPVCPVSLRFGFFCNLLLQATVLGYDWKSGEHPTWMESRWDSSLIRVYLITDPIWEGAILIIGILTLLVSFIAVFIVSNGSDMCFSCTAL